MTRIGLIGCGGLARAVHIPALRRISGLRLAAIAEPEVAARALAAKLAPEARLFERHEEMLADAGIGAVIIACPPAQHAAVAIDAIHARKHVYLEKPMAATLEEARRVIDTWAGSGLVGVIGLNYRYHPLLVNLRDLTRKSAAGSISAVRSSFSIAPGSHPPWKKSRSTGGGVLLDLASHHFDLVHFLFEQEVTQVSATIRSVVTEQDCATVELRLADGLPIQCFFSLCAAEQDRWQVFGSGGTLTVDRYFSEQVEFTGVNHLRARVDGWGHAVRRMVPGPALFSKLRAPLHEPSFLRALEAFAAAVAGATPSADLPTFYDGYRAMRIIDAAERSASSGAPQPCVLPRKETSASHA